MGQRGPQPGTGGRPRKSLAEKLLNGNPGKRKLKVIEAEEPLGADMPPPKEFLSAIQRDGSVLQASEIYADTFAWLESRQRQPIELRLRLALLGRFDMGGINAAKASIPLQKGLRFFNFSGSCGTLRYECGSLDFPNGTSFASQCEEAVFH